MKKFITFILIASAANVFAQQTEYKRCSTDEYLEELSVNNPQEYASIMAAQQEAIKWDENHTHNTTAKGVAEVITIPVVVHVVYKTSAQNISFNQIQSQIDILNEDFRGMNADITNTPAVFPYADSEIQFCLASVDPAGNPTNGITRTSTAKSSFSNSDMKRTANGGHDPWDRNKYLNIWVCDLTGGLLGFATLPGGSASLDGVAIDYQFFGDIGTATPPFNLGRTATHEIGHWLGLSHIWGNGTCGNDFVADTPQQNGPTTGCPSFPKFSSCGGPNFPDGDMFMNYMDYSNDACLYMFTPGQAARMQGVLNTSRATIKTSANSKCYTNIGLEENKSIVNFSVYPNPAKEKTTVEFSLSSTQDVSYTLVSITGQIITEVAAQEYRAGNHTITINTTELTNGIYYLNFRAGNAIENKKVAIFK